MMPGMPDLGQLLQQAQQMQAEMERAQASLSEQEVTGTSGGGLVTAVLNGGGDLLRLTIDPSVVDPADVETLEDLIVAAVHDARRAAQDIANDTMGAAASGLTGSLDLSALGLSLPNFGPADEEDEYLDDERFHELGEVLALYAPGQGRPYSNAEELRSIIRHTIASIE